MGKLFQPAVLKVRLLGLWKLKKDLEIIHLGKGFYTVFNLLEEDRTKILTSRWRVGLDPVQVWKPNFGPKKEKEKMVTTTWARLPFLPIELDSPKLLVENLIWTTVALDARNSAYMQATYARICIEVNLSANLPSEIWVNNRSQKVIYKNFSFLCSSNPFKFSSPKFGLLLENQFVSTIPMSTKNFHLSKNSQNSNSKKPVNILSHYYSKKGINYMH